MPGSLLMELEGVHAAYSTRKASAEVFSGISTRIHAGDAIAVVGSSGCGKTTMLRVLAGEMPTSRGTIRYHFDVNHPGQFGYVSQSNSLLPWLNLRDNVRLPLRILRRKGDVWPRIQEMLDEVGLGEHGSKFPRELSGGMARRAVLARTLVCEPRILLLDEPFGGLDAGTRGRLVHLLGALRKKHGFTQICVEHDIVAAAHLSDRFWILRGAGASMDEIDFRTPPSSQAPTLDERIRAVTCRLEAAAEVWEQGTLRRKS